MEEPLRVAQIIGKWVGGGVESVVMNYYRYIDKTKIQFDFFIDEDSTMEPPVEEIENLGGKVYKIPSYTRIIKYHKELKKLLKENNYKIVHSHVNTLSVFPLFAAKCAKVPVRIAHSHSISSNKELKRNLIKQILRPFSKVFATDYMCCGELAGKWMFGNRTYDKGKVYLLNNAINLEKFKYDEKTRNILRKKMKIDNSTKVIGHVGRFVKTKNHEFLINIFKEFKKQEKDTKLLLVGTGPLISKIQKIVDDMNLHDDIIFLGQRNDVNELYQVMDVFVLPSLYEGFPVVGVEAQVSGLLCYFSNTMTKKIKISQESKILPLECDAKFWANQIVNDIRKINRNSNLNLFKTNGFDINKEAKKLTQKYINLYKKL